MANSSDGGKIAEALDIFAFRPPCFLTSRVVVWALCDTYTNWFVPLPLLHLLVVLLTGSNLGFVRTVSVRSEG